MKAFVICCAALVSGTVFLALGAQTPQSGTTTRVDPAFDAIVSPGTAMETVKGGFGFINGIVWVRESGGGHLLISDIPANVVHRWTPDGKMSPFLEKPDWTRTTGRPANPRFGANGITVDPQGRVVYAAEADRAVVRLEKDGKRTILAEALRREASEQPERPGVSIGRRALLHGSQRRQPFRRLGSEEGVALSRRVPAQGRQAAAGHPGSRPSERDRPVARREVSLRQRLGQAHHHAVRGATRWHALPMASCSRT